MLPTQTSNSRTAVFFLPADEKAHEKVIGLLSWHCGRVEGSVEEAFALWRAAQTRDTILGPHFSVKLVVVCQFLVFEEIVSNKPG
jgi:hypothetical protein